MSIRSRLFSQPPNLDASAPGRVYLPAFSGKFSLQARPRSLRIAYWHPLHDYEMFAGEVPLLTWANTVDRIDSDIVSTREWRAGSIKNG